MKSNITLSSRGMISWVMMKNIFFKLLLSGALLMGYASTCFAVSNTEGTAKIIDQANEATSSKAIIKPLNYTVYLLTMKGSQATDRGGDALFMHVVQYLSSGDTSAERIPAGKATWQLDTLKDINKLKLVEFHLAPQDAITTVFSLLEEDKEPWATTDLVGSIRLRVRNDDGTLAYQWGIPNRTDGPEVIATKYGNARRFALYGDGGKYILYLILLPTEQTHDNKLAL